MFFQGMYKRKKVFVKLGINSVFINNEISIVNKLCENNSPFFIKPIFNACVSKKRKSICIIVYPFMCLQPLFFRDEYDFKKVCSSAIEILDILNKQSIVHCDISSSNLVLDKNNNLLLIDFDDAHIFGVNNGINYNKHGTHKIILPTGSLRFDDAYSFALVLSTIAGNAWNYVDEYKYLMSRVGKTFYDFYE